MDLEWATLISLEGTVFPLDLSDPLIRGLCSLSSFHPRQAAFYRPSCLKNNCFESIYFFWDQCKIYVTTSQDVRSCSVLHRVHRSTSSSATWWWSVGGEDPRGDAFPIPASFDLVSTIHQGVQLRSFWMPLLPWLGRHCSMGPVNVPRLSENVLNPITPGP